MSNFRNLKIQINDQQPLDEVVKALELKGYKKFAWSNHVNTVCVLTYENNGWISDYGCFIKDTDFVLTTLAELKEM